MNIFFLTIIIFLLIYFFLTWFVNSKSKKIKNIFRKSLILGSIAFAILATFAGRYIFSLPFLLAILPLIKTKAGITLFQVLRLWSLIRVLKNSGRFSFNQSTESKNFPPMANKTAKKANNKIVISLTPFDIFFGEIFDHHFNKKYKMTNITTR